MRFTIKLESGLPYEQLVAKMLYHSRASDVHEYALAFYLYEFEPGCHAIIVSHEDFQPRVFELELGPGENTIGPLAIWPAGCEPPESPVVYDGCGD